MNQQYRRLAVARRVSGTDSVRACEALGICRSQLQQLESGEITPTGWQLERLASLYRVDVRWLSGALPQLLSMSDCSPEVRGALSQLRPGNRALALERLAQLGYEVAR